MRSIPWAGVTPGAVGALAAAVLLAPMGGGFSVDREEPGVSKTHAQVVTSDGPQVSHPVAVEDTRALGAAAEGLAPPKPGRASADAAAMDEYLDPDAPVAPPAMLAGDVLPEDDFQDPEYDLPLPVPHEGISEVGEYSDPGDAP